MGMRMGMGMRELKYGLKLAEIRLISFVFIQMINYISYMSESVKTHVKRTFLKCTKNTHTYVCDFFTLKKFISLMDCK